MKIEADVFGRYIVGKVPGSELSQRYEEAKQKLGLDKDDPISNLCLRFPLLLPYFDAGLAIKNREHLLERKLLLMFSILETSPQFAHYFLAQKRSFLYFFSIFLIGIRAIFKSTIGLLLVWFFVKK